MARGKKRKKTRKTKARKTRKRKTTRTRKRGGRKNPKWTAAQRREYNRGKRALASVINRGGKVHIGKA